MTNTQLSLTTVNRQLLALRQRKPLVHCLTNEVVQSFTANTLLALDASPAMVVAPQEIRQFVTLADSLLINVGTLYQQRAESMLLAAQTAYETKTPWVLDPVAVGALDYRTEFVRQLLAYQPIAIRGNASEILALAGYPSSAKGADSTNSSEQARPAAKELAQRYKTVVAVTGATDYITDGKHCWSVPWGSLMMTKVTGCGCALSAAVAAFIVDAISPLDAVASACGVFALAGQQAAQRSTGPGSFIPVFIDTLFTNPALSLMETE